MSSIAYQLGLKLQKLGLQIQIAASEKPNAEPRDVLYYRDMQDFRQELKEVSDAFDVPWDDDDG